MSRILLPASLLTVLSGPSFAIQPPPDSAPPPAPVQPPPGAKQAAPPQNPKPSAAVETSSAYLGVITHPVPEMLATHLKLSPDNGILIRLIAEDGPAAGSELQIYDVITHVDGKPVSTPAQFSEILSGYKPGDELTIDRIHQGQAGSCKVVLGTRPNAFAQTVEPRRKGLDLPMLDDMPDLQANRIREAIEQNLRALDQFADGFGAAKAFPPQINDLLREMDERLSQNLGNEFDSSLPGGRFQLQHESSYRLMDNEGSVEVRSNEKGKQVTVRDHDNRVLWSGPWNSEEEQSAAPDEIRERINKLNFEQSTTKNGFRFHFGSGR